METFSEMFSFPFMLEYQLTFADTASVLEKEKISRQHFLSPLGVLVYFSWLKRNPSTALAVEHKSRVTGAGCSHSSGWAGQQEACLCYNSLVHKENEMWRLTHLVKSSCLIISRNLNIILLLSKVLFLSASRIHALSAGWTRTDHLPEPLQGRENTTFLHSNKPKLKS